MFEKLLSYIGSVVSIIGLGLTIYVAIDLSRIKNKYIFRLGAPDLLKDLKKINGALLGYSSDVKTSSMSIHGELVKVDVKLRSFEKRLTAEAKESVKELRQLIKDYENRDREELLDICRCLARVIEEVKQRQLEMLLGG